MQVNGFTQVCYKIYYIPKLKNILFPLMIVSTINPFVG